MSQLQRYEPALPKLRVWCDSCQAEFLLGAELIGQTVQCGRCRNYFLVVPAPTRSKDFDGPAKEDLAPIIQVRSAIRLLPRAWMEDGSGVQWFVRYPVYWAEVLHCLLALSLLSAGVYGFVTGMGFLLAALAGGNLWAFLALMVLVIPLASVLYPLYLWQQASIPRFETRIYGVAKARGRPVLLIRPGSLWRWLLGRWSIENDRGEILAELYYAGWLVRLLTRQCWILRLPTWKCSFIIEETLWLSGVVRWLLLLPLGLLRLVFFLTPWFLRPFRPNYQVRLAGSSYILARSRTQLSLRHTTLFDVHAGAEQFLDRHLIRALAALLHAQT